MVIVKRSNLLTDRAVCSLMQNKCPRTRPGRGFPRHRRADGGSRRRVAGAPVYSLLVQSSSVVRDQIFKAPGAALPAEQLKLVHEAILSACDARDGLKDGVVTHPRRCGWEPKSLQCKKGVAGTGCPDAAAGRGARQGVSNGTHTEWRREQLRAHARQ